MKARQKPPSATTTFNRKRAIRSLFRILKNLAENGSACMEEAADDRTILDAARTAASEAIKVAVAVTVAIDEAEKARRFLDVIASRGDKRAP